MNYKKNSVRSLRPARVFYHIGLIFLILLSIASLTATVSANSIAAPKQQGLPTRPPSAAATPTPSDQSPQQTPTSTTDAQATPAVDATPILTSTQEVTPTVTPVARPALTTRSGKTIDLTFEDLGYYSRILKSLEDQANVTLQLPYDILLNEEGNYVEIIVNHEPPAPNPLSTLRITFNKNPLGIINLTEENAEPTALRFELPASYFQLGNNRLEITLDTGERCGIRGATVDVGIDYDSYFHLEYDLRPYPADLTYYPKPFYDPSFDPDTVYFVIPDTPSSADLSAAATIAAGLGQVSNKSVQLGAVLDSELTAEIRNQHHLIVIGKKGANRTLDRLNLPLALEEAHLSEEQGVIQELISPWNPLNMILVVSGLSDEGVRKASQALNRESHFLGMRGQVSIVQDVLPIPAPESGPIDIDLTFDAMGFSEEVICGTNPHRSQYRFYMPLNWTMLEEPHLKLSFSHSEIIDPKTSSINVEFNGGPIRSIVLDTTNAIDGLVDIALPAWRMLPNRNTIDITTELNVEDDDKCLFINDCQVWAAIHSNSYVHLPFTTEEIEPTLGIFPYPFNRQRNLDDLLLVTPDKPHGVDLDGMVKLAALLGSGARGDAIALNVVTGDNVTEEAQQENQLIIMGRPTKNTSIQELNPWLPQPFEKDTDLLQPAIDSVVFVQDPERDAGLIQELTSPWNTSQTILVLSGTTDEGLAMSYRTLYNRTGELDGNVAVIESPRDTLHTHETRSLASRKEAKEPSKIGVDISRLSKLGEWWW